MQASNDGNCFQNEPSICIAQNFPTTNSPTFTDVTNELNLLDQLSRKAFSLKGKPDFSFSLSIANKINSILEKSISEYTELIQRHQALLAYTEIDGYHRRFNQILSIFENVFKSFPNNLQYLELGGVTDLLYVCLSFKVIRKALRIIYFKFKNMLTNNRIQEPHLSKICQYTNFLFKHYNVGSLHTSSIQDLFPTDPQVAASFKNILFFEVLGKNECSNNTWNISINLDEKYKNESHLTIRKLIEFNDELNEGVLQPHEGLALAFKIRASAGMEFPCYRIEVIKAVLESFNLILALQRLKSQKKEFQDLDEDLPDYAEIISFTSSCFDLLVSGRVPDLAQKILEITAQVLKNIAKDDNQLRNFKRQVKMEDSFLHSLLKDCMVQGIQENPEAMQLEGKPCANNVLIFQPSILPIEVVRSERFFVNLIHLISLRVFLMGKSRSSDEKYQQNKLYTFTGIVNTFFAMLLQLPEKNCYFYNMFLLHEVGDFLLRTLDNECFAMELNVTDKLLQRMGFELESIVKIKNQGVKGIYYQLLGKEWHIVEIPGHLKFFRKIMLKLKTPFEANRTIPRGPADLTKSIAEKIMHENFLKTLKEVLSFNMLCEDLYIDIMQLIVGILKLFPTFFEGLVVGNVFNALLGQFGTMKIKSKRAVEVVLAFIKVIGKKKQGLPIERKYNLLECLFKEIVCNEEFLLLKDGIHEIGKMTGELAKESEHYRTIIENLILKWMDCMTQEKTRIEGQWEEVVEFQKKEQESSPMLEIIEKEEKIEAEILPEDIEVQNGKIFGLCCGNRKTNIECEEQIAGLQRPDKVNPLETFKKTLKKFCSIFQMIGSLSLSILAADETLRKNLACQHFFDILFAILSFPFLVLSEFYLMVWVSPCFRLLVSCISKQESSCFQMKIQKQICLQIQALEKLVGNLCQIQDLSQVLSPELCYEVRLKGLYAVVLGKKPVDPRFLKLLGHLSHIELLADFLRYSPNIYLNSTSTMQVAEKLRALYLAIINQNRNEDQDCIRRVVTELETSWPTLTQQRIKERLMKCVQIQCSTYLSVRLNNHCTLGKLLKKLIGTNCDVQGVQLYAASVLELIHRIKDEQFRDISTTEGLKDVLWKVISLHDALSYILDFLLNTSYRKMRASPEFVLRVYERSGYHLLLGCLERLFTFVEDNGKFFLNNKDCSNTEFQCIDDALGIFLKKIVGLCINKAGQITKLICLFPVGLNLDAKVDGKVIPCKVIKMEYCLAACAEVFGLVKNIFLKLNTTLTEFYKFHQAKCMAKKREKLEKKMQRELEKEKSSLCEKKEMSSDTFFENIGKAICCVIGCLKKTFDIKRELCQEEGQQQNRGSQNEEDSLRLFRRSFFPFPFTRQPEQPRPQEMAIEEPRSQCPFDISFGVEPEIQSYKCQNFKKRELQRLPKEYFIKKIFTEMFCELKNHILSNIFKFEGYFVYIFDLLKNLMFCCKPEKRSEMEAELAVAVYKTLQTGMNTFYPNSKFVKGFKITSEMSRRATQLIERPLALLSIKKNCTSTLERLRVIGSCLAWMKPFLINCPYFEENFMNQSFLLGFTRYANQVFQEVKTTKPFESLDLLYEEAGSVIEELLQLILSMSKMKNYKESYFYNQKEEALSAEEKQAQKKKARAKERFHKEKKQEMMKLLVSILDNNESISKMDWRNVILGKDRLSLYVKAMNQIVFGNEYAAQLFVEKGGLEKLLRYEIEIEESKKANFTKELADFCVNLAKSKTLDFIGLECQIKTLFWEERTKKMKLRTFAEKFSDYFVMDSQGTLKLIKRLCLIENRSASVPEPFRRERTGQRGPTIEIRGERTGQRSDWLEFLNESPCPFAEWDSEFLEESRENREKNQDMMICLRNDVEYSKLYTLEIFDNEDQAANILGSMNVKQAPHIQDYEPPNKCKDVLRTIVETIVSQINNDIVESEKQCQIGEENNKQCTALFQAPVLLRVLQTILTRYPFLSGSVLAHNIANVCRTAPMDSYIRKVLEQEGEPRLSFLRYYLRVVVFCTLDSFQNFLVGFGIARSVIIDKDRNGVEFPSPFNFLLKKYIVHEIYQILKEQVKEGASWCHTPEKVRLFCGVSGILLNLLPLKDIAKIIRENTKEYDFIRVYNKAFNQLQANPYERTSLIIPFVVEPFSILVNYNTAFVMGKFEKEIEDLSSVWMPKEMIGNSGAFCEDWRKLMNMNSKSDDNHSMILRIDEESDFSDVSPEDASEAELIAQDEGIEEEEDPSRMQLEEKDKEEEEEIDETEQKEKSSFQLEEEIQRTKERTTPFEEEKDWKGLETDPEKNGSSPKMNEECGEKNCCQNNKEEETPIYDENFLDNIEVSAEPPPCNLKDFNPDSADSNLFPSSFAASQVHLSDNYEIQRINSAFQHNFKNFDQNLAFLTNRPVMSSPYDNVHSKLQPSILSPFPIDEPRQNQEFHEQFFGNTLSSNMLLDEPEDSFDAFRIRNITSNELGQQSRLPSVFNTLMNLTNRARRQDNGQDSGPLPGISRISLIHPSQSVRRLFGSQLPRSFIPVSYFTIISQDQNSAPQNQSIANFESSLVEDFSIPQHTARPQANPYLPCNFDFCQSTRPEDRCSGELMTFENDQLECHEPLQMEAPLQNRNNLSTRAHGENTEPQLDQAFLAELPQDLEQEIQCEFPQCMAGGCRDIDNNNTNEVRRPRSIQGSQSTENIEETPTENRIPSEFINAVPQNLQDRLLTLNGPQNSQRPGNNNPLIQEPLNNSLFVSQLCPELQQEVLRTADQNFLATLSPRLRSDNQITEERNAPTSNPLALRNTINIEPMTSDPLQINAPFFEGERDLRSTIESMRDRLVGIRRLINDTFTRRIASNSRLTSSQANIGKKKKTNLKKITQCDEQTIESIIGLLYNDQETFENFPLKLLRSFLPVNSTQYKVLHCLLFLLSHPNLDKLVPPTASFPLTALQTKFAVEKNYEVVYSTISLRILFVLEHLSRNKHLRFFSGANSNKPCSPLKSIELLVNQEISENKEELPFLTLIKLIQSPTIQSNVLHLKLLLNLLSNLTKHFKELSKTQRRYPSSSRRDRISRPLLWSSESPVFGSRSFDMFTENSGCLDLSFNNPTFGLAPRRTMDESSQPIAEEKKTSESSLILTLSEEFAHILCSCITNPCMEEDMFEKLRSTILSLSYNVNNFTTILHELNQNVYICSHQMNDQLESYTGFICELNTQEQQENDKAKQVLITRQKDDRTEAFYAEMEKLATQLKKMLVIVKELFKHSLLESLRKKMSEDESFALYFSRRDVKEIDEDFRKAAKNQFKEVLETNELRSLWIGTTNFLSSFTQSLSHPWMVTNPFAQRLQPILESFFLVYKVLYDEDSYRYYQQNRLISKPVKKAQSFGVSKLKEEEGGNGGAIPMPTVCPISENKTNGIEIENSKETFEQRVFGMGKNYDPEAVLQWICEKNKCLINAMVRQNPKVLGGVIGIVMRKFPKLLDFDNKRNYFNSQLKKIRRGLYSNVKLQVRRTHLFTDSYEQIIERKPHELLGKLSIEFQGEEAVDVGGVAREWFLKISKEILNPNYALFKPAANGTTYQPSPQSSVNSDHLKYFKFVGRVVGKALQEGYLMDCNFTRPFYKHILNQPLTCQDFSLIDQDYYKNLKWIMDNDVTDLDLTFSYESEEFGQIVVKDLKEGGRNIPVTETNKREYLYMLCYAHMADGIKDQIEAFLEGLHEIVPPELIQIFNSKELELMITGLPEINIEDLQKNTEYQNYTSDSEVITWLWDILENFESCQKAAFLQFVTGTSKVPCGGFKELRGVAGNKQKFQIHKCYDTTKLPTAHTCFNQLDLPEYSSPEILKRKLLLAITEGREGFGFV